LTAPFPRSHVSNDESFSHKSGDEFLDTALNNSQLGIFDQQMLIIGNKEDKAVYSLYTNLYG
jgi:hypothetical protein